MTDVISRQQVIDALRDYLVEKRCPDDGTRQSMNSWELSLSGTYGRRERRMARCRSCGAEIRWIKMSSGKAMPVDPDQVPYWARPGAAGKVVTPNGEVYSCDFEGDTQKATGAGYVSHFSTCPNADQHRRR